MKNTIGTLLPYTLFFQPIFDIEERNEKWREKIKQQWRDSMQLPRKKKKALRKELLLNWSLASWNPLNFNY